MAITAMANLAIKVADLDAACTFYNGRGARRWPTASCTGTTASGPTCTSGRSCITLFTRAIYEDVVEPPREGFLHPALFTDDLDAELAGHDVCGGRRSSKGRSAPGGSRSSPRRAGSASSSWSSSRRRVRVTRFHHVSVNSNGTTLDEMAAFYRDVLGLGDEPRPEIPGVAGHWHDGRRPATAPRRRAATRQGRSTRRATTTASRSTISTPRSPSSTRNGCRTSRGAQGRGAGLGHRPRGQHDRAAARPHPVSFTPYDRPVRAAFVGLGRIYDLNARAYLDNPDVEVVALVDPRRATARSERPTGRTRRRSRRRRTRGEWHRGRCGRGAAAGAAARRRRARTARPRLAREPAEADVQRPRRRAAQMLAAAHADDRVLRVMENYLFYEPLQRLKAAAGGEFGEISGYHMKMVGSGRGGWDVPDEQLRVAVQQMRHRPRHPRVRRRVAQALDRALVVRTVREVRAWVGPPRSYPTSRSTRRPRSRGSTTTACRGVWDITLAVDLYLRSDYYTNDERWEVTGRQRLRRASTGAPGAASSSQRSRCTPTASCRSVPHARRRLGIIVRHTSESSTATS